MKQLKKHLTYYLSLGLIFAIGVSLSVQASLDKQLQILIIFTTAILYVLWGILHHFLDHDITVKIVVEYVLMGGIGIMVALFFLRSGL